MENINDYTRYTLLMRNGFYDKLFFLDKLFHSWESMLDYGCSEGFLTKMIGQIFPEKMIAGYDEDEQMLNLARYGGPASSNVFFTSKKNTLVQTDCIFLSSVVHEVYSYAKGGDSVKEFWKMVFNPKRKYVIIRDMMAHNWNPYPAQEQKIYNAIWHYCARMNCTGELARFCDRYVGGHVKEPLHLAHFLLKMPYITSPNWNRELHENYLPVSMDNLKFLAPDGWEIVYEEAYQLPYLRHWWKINLGIDVPYNTHGKLIFYNKNA